MAGESQEMTVEGIDFELSRREQFKLRAHKEQYKTKSGKWLPWLIASYPYSLVEGMIVRERKFESGERRNEKGKDERGKER